MKACETLTMTSSFLLHDQERLSLILRPGSFNLLEFIGAVAMSFLLDCGVTWIDYGLSLLNVVSNVILISLVHSYLLSFPSSSLLLLSFFSVPSPSSVGPPRSRRHRHHIDNSVLGPLPCTPP